MSKKKKVLLVGGHHFKITEIASLRPRKIAKYLTLSGRYDVHALTSVNRSEIKEKTPEGYIDSSNKDEYISGYTIIPCLSGITAYRVIGKPFRLIWRGFWGLMKNLFKIKKPRNRRNILFAFNLFGDTSFYRRSKRAIRRERLWDTDVVISTYGPYASHYIARYIKKKNPAVFWIAHFDDPVYKKNHVPPVFVDYAKNYPKRVCKTADAITAVSQGFLDMMELPGVPAHVIENGFDPDEAPGTASIGNEKFTITYTGTAYKKMQDVSALLRAVRELIDEGKTDEDRLLIEYAGSNADFFTGQVEESGLGSIFRSYGFVSHEKALEIQSRSSILLVASWNREDYYGVLTAKIYEYMMMNKPIIVIIAGDLPNSELKEAVNRCSLGFCYEEACGENDYPLLKEYIHNQYQHFIEHGDVLFKPNIEEINRYSYPYLVERLEDLFTNRGITAQTAMTK